MKVTLPEGQYVLAVSGGVDSVSLLHAVKDMPGVELVVAHYDHGIRPDSAKDRRFVQDLAKKYGLPFVFEEGELGPDAGEAAAREARYGFLENVKREHKARAIVTAHHRDDVLETAVINLLRGSGRKGLTALASREGLERPLLDVPKSKVEAYARRHDLEWREDPTNQDTGYLRNYVRHELLPRFDEKGRERLWKIIGGLKVTNAELDGILAGQLAVQPSVDRLDRGWFIGLPHDVSREMMAAWLRSQGVRGFDRKTLERLVAAAKTAAPGRSFDVVDGAVIKVSAGHLALDTPERYPKRTGAV
jgi:tRNA(Ile)-lysidine synthetase-like protein